MKTTKEDRTRLRKNTAVGLGISDYAADMLLDDIDTLEARLAAVEELLGRAERWIAVNHEMPNYSELLADLASYREGK